MIPVLKYFPHDERNQFLSVPDYEPLDDGVNWVSTKPMTYVDQWGDVIEVPAGFKSDFASIPDLSRIGLYVQILFIALGHWLWTPLYSVAVLASVVIYIAESFLHEGTWDVQAFNHDFMFATRCRPFWKANWILFKSMVAKGAAKTPTWKRVLIFGGVTLGGYAAWVSDAKKNKLKASSNGQPNPL